MEQNILPIHFGNLQGKHQINSDSLLTFVEAYKEIAEFFGLIVDIQISVPEEGGWKANLLFAASLTGLSPVAALLTGETADDWGKKGHTYIIQEINKFITQKAAVKAELYPRECIKQKNKIYQQFQHDKCIDSFRLNKYPPIPRNDFHLYISELPDEELQYLGETDITVHSPDWKGKRSWRGKIGIIEDNESAFDFDKDTTGKFWEKVKLDTLPLHTTDVMRVQLLKRPTNKVRYLVIRVLSYNSESIDSPISVKDIHKFSNSSFQTGTINPPAQSKLRW